MLLTPGSYNSAYFEHTFLARQMGIEIVEGRDLVVHRNRVFMRTTSGLERVDVIYRRDRRRLPRPARVPRATRCSASPGCCNAYRAGNVALANAIGTGIADDKAIYPFVPAMIRYYLGEEPICSRRADATSRADEPTARTSSRTSTSWSSRPSNESGGYGMLIGPQSTAAERERVPPPASRPTRATTSRSRRSRFSRHPTFVDGELRGRHVDLRPFVLSGDDATRIVPGGLTRVALRPGSLVVNSSQGGGSKDTWVLRT